jgi:hypothetical protein
MTPLGIEPDDDSDEWQVKEKFTLELEMKTQWGVEVYLYSFFLTWVPDCGVFNTTPRPLYPPERDPLPIVWEAGCTSGPA